ncbi:YTA7 [Candida margitis]|uniref:YTA7 n=1 Tax=Candida margitis TaxID=1775924 RepID=UPI002226EB5F|nr:YTA7 [Candida margitis]KAI5969766.1 YTA7 [Candida margitis]
MAKRSRRIDSTDDDNEYDYEEAEAQPRRSTKNISYNEDDDDENATDVQVDEQADAVPADNNAKKEDELDSDDPFGVPTSPEKDDDSEDYVEESDVEIRGPGRKKRKVGRKGRAKGRSNKPRIDSEDEEFRDDGDDSDEEEDDFILSDDEFVERKKRDNFIVEDENEWDDGESEYGVRPKKKRGRKKKSRSESAEPRRATRSGKVLQELDPGFIGDDTHDDGQDDVDDIQREIAELYDSSPMRDSEPSQHKLRQRAKVDYTIPPPITNDLMLERPSTPASIRNRRGRPANKSDFRKILYPTAGPFGGSDVISLFGTNIPPGGIPLPGMSDPNNLTAIGQNVSDSDSSEDEIAPINGEATISHKEKKPSKSEGKLLTGGSDDKKKAKNSLSDTDPLGVDMNIDFSVVGGLDNYINQLKEMVALPLLYPELYQNFGITPPRGVLFHGPPGTGKTLMARALAANCSTPERKITFFMRKGADCLSKWVGEAERQLRLLFEEAKNQQPSIIFFDEIDGLAPVRSSKQEQIHASIVSTLLALMDGMDNRGQVIVIGATNRPDAIDPALRRPGRFDREFYFPLPDINARKEILTIHTRKWTPPLDETFLSNLAELTKGYGGADLRALCTEAALNSIQRKYPQIYETNHKLAVKPEKVKVIAKDFMMALDKIVASSARSTSSGSAPLPENLKPLLIDSFEQIKSKLKDLIPVSISVTGRKKLTTLEEAKYLDPTIHDKDGGFGKQQLLKNLENARICRPHLLVSGEEGNGQQYLSAAVLNYLEGFQVQSLDLGTMFGDSTRTTESAIIQAFIEARRHQPAIILIPNIDVWYQILPDSAKATLSSLLRGLRSNEKILLLGFSETPLHYLDDRIKYLFGLENSSNNVILQNATKSARKEFFSTVWKTILMKPYEFVNDLQNRPRRKLKQLKVVETVSNLSNQELIKRKKKEQEYNDTKLKNTLKIKLASLMDLFKVRYKRFKKPIVDENLLYHLFDPLVLENPLNNYQVLYTRADEPGHENMIKELATGKNYYNMDLDTIEERLWNGFYSEPRQFLKDLKLILKDCITSGDRERILKANEMITNAQFGIDDFSTPEFLKACKEMRERDKAKQEKLLKEYEVLKLKMQNGAVEQVAEVANVENNGSAATATEQESVLTPLPNGDASHQKEEIAAAAMDVDFHEDKKESLAESNEQQKEEIEQPREEVKEQKEENEAEPQVEAEVEKEDSESEAEDSFAIDHSREIVLNKDLFDKLKKQVVKITDQFTIDRLEMVMARLMDIVWNDRNEWDKTSTLDNIEKVLTSFQPTS